METALKKPYLTSWLAIPLLVLLSIVFSHHTVDIQLADTYYVIGNPQFAFVASLFLLLLGTGYWLISRKNKIPNRTLTVVHLLLTLAALVTFVLPLSNSNGLVWDAMAFVLSQCLYILNLFMALFQHKPFNHHQKPEW